MNKRFAFFISIALMAAPAFGQDQKAQRGKYLVEEVARCQECHTPKTDAGDLDTAKMLKGAKLNVAPIATIQRGAKSGEVPSQR